MSRWVLHPEFAQGPAAELFADLDKVFAIQAETITRDGISDVQRLRVGDQQFYVKRYVEGGKNLRRFIGRPRIRAEWENLLKFKRWGIPTVPVVAYGMQRRGLAFDRGALVTLGMQNTRDLAEVARSHKALLQNDVWRASVIQQVARATRIMHDHGFAHNDLKWRNILVDAQMPPNIYLIDCPAGSKWPGPLLNYRIIKDLACLDKVAKWNLRRTDRLRFYLMYAGRTRLNSRDKKRIRRIVQFFEGRE